MFRKLAKYFQSVNLYGQSNEEAVTIPRSEGALLALVARSPNVENLEGTCVDARPMLLKERYQYSYERFDIAALKSVTTPEKTTIELTIENRFCDFINNIDLCIENPYNSDPFDIIESIETDYGGVPIDRISDAQTYKTACALNNRVFTHHGDRTYVPVALAPVHRNNLAFSCNTDARLVLRIAFKRPYTGEFEIYGNKYYVEISERKKLKSGDHSFAIAKTVDVYPEGFEIEKGSNVIDISKFEGAAYALCVWGVNKSKIRNIRLEFNDYTFYDGPIEALEHAKAQRNLGSLDPIIIFFSDRALTEDSAVDSSVNFSSIDKISLSVDADASAKLRVSAIVFETLEYSDGRVSLA